MPVELDDELALAFSVLRAARTPLAVPGDGISKDSLSSPDADSPIRWGKVVAASDPWAGGITDGSLICSARYMAPENLAIY